MAKSVLITGAAATPSAVVVNLSSASASASAIRGQPELAVYSATKFFIRAITEALDLEWEPYSIRVASTPAPPTHWEYI